MTLDRVAFPLSSDDGENDDAATDAKKPLPPNRPAKRQSRVSTYFSPASSPRLPQRAVAGGRHWQEEEEEKEEKEEEEEEDDEEEETEEEEEEEEEEQATGAMAGPMAEVTSSTDDLHCFVPPPPEVEFQPPPLGSPLNWTASGTNRMSMMGGQEFAPPASRRATSRHEVVEL